MVVELQHTAYWRLNGVEYSSAKSSNISSKLRTANHYERGVKEHITHSEYQGTYYHKNTVTFRHFPVNCKLFLFPETIICN